MRLGESVLPSPQRDENKVKKRGEETGAQQGTQTAPTLPSPIAGLSSTANKLVLSGTAHQQDSESHLSCCDDLAHFSFHSAPFCLRGSHILHYMLKTIFGFHFNNAKILVFTRYETLRQSMLLFIKHGGGSPEASVTGGGHCPTAHTIPWMHFTQLSATFHK